MRPLMTIWSKHHFLMPLAAVLLLSSATRSQPSLPLPPTLGEVIKRIDQAGYAREQNLVGYTVREKYSLFRRGDDTPAAVIVVDTSYKKGSGKTYNVASESGSTSGKLVLRRVLNREQQLSQGEDREGILITSRNYDMALDDFNQHDFLGRQCLVLSVRPKRASPYLLAGRIWVDAATYHLVRIEGKPTADPSMWTGTPMIERDYTDVDGVPVAIHARSTSKQRLLGETVLDIIYQDYHLSR